MTELDSRGLEAATRAWHDGPIEGRLSRAIRAYLDATRPTGAADRLAVVVGSDGVIAAMPLQTDVSEGDGSS